MTSSFYAQPNQRGGQLLLGQLLVERGLISLFDLTRALAAQERTGDRLGSILMSLGMVKRQQLYRVLADLWGHSFVDLIKNTPDAALVRRFDYATLSELRFVPRTLHTLSDGTPWLEVATSDQPSEAVTRRCQRLLGSDVHIAFSVTTDWDIGRSLADVFRDELVLTATMGLYNRNPEESAYRTFRKWQIEAAVLGVLLLIIGLVLVTVETLVVLSAFVNFAFLGSIVFKVVTSLAGAEGEHAQAVSERDLAQLDERDLPFYTILVPVFREANVVPALVENLRRLDYPASKLEIFLLIEEVDEETLEAARAAHPPESVTLMIVPDGVPRTKPRACNVGLMFARGEYLVIYDAEDRPEPDQLKKAVVAFRRGGDKLVCIQAALNYFNASENFLTRMFTLEYSFWFDYMLPGLERLKLPIPLGGTSSHFRTDALRKLGGWDPFNVTEDADLGIRASAEGYQVGVVNSTTYEEANNEVGNWIRQRSRWIKGYMQTTLVYLRNPVRLTRSVGVRSALAFALLIGGTPLTFLALLPMWLMFVAWLVIGFPLDTLYPPWVLYVGLFNLILGNGLMIAVNMLGVGKRHNYGLITYALANPLYWTLHSIAAYKALWQLITKPSYWEKTRHGVSTYVQPAEPVFTPAEAGFVEAPSSLDEDQPKAA
jgi:cellulose synthase/poly-beta-1,6-N-acetylglucosamine synthase-like glycosyltransferase